MAQKVDATVFIGRFSPFHLGHAHVLRNALETSRLVVVLIGSSDLSRSLKNPFTFNERKSMIESWYAGTGRHVNDQDIAALQILPLHDHPYNDTDWITEVQTKVKSCISAYSKDCWAKSSVTPMLTDIRITGSDRDESTWYLNSFPQWKQALVSEHRNANGSGLLHATEIRRLLFEFDEPVTEALFQRLPEPTFKFLEAFVRSPEHALLAQEYKANMAYKKAWSVAPYAPIFSTVDAIVIQSGHVLVVERGAFPGKGLWALPGGFLNQNERLQDGAIRELIEETGIRLAEGKKSKELTEAILKGSIRDKEIFDKPDRSSRGRTITVGYLIRLDDTKPLPTVKGQNMPLHESGGREIVETAKAFWLPISEALRRRSMWFEDHHGILEHFVSQSGDR